MSGSASISVAVGLGIGGGGEVGYGGYRTPFTAVQWQELEHQAMIYKYLVAGLQVPPDLVMPIRRSFEALSARFFHNSSLGYCSYYGKKFDPEPGRCRRTDGKKWRCAKDSHPDSKYCERHMHRGRNRSRKPVESQNNPSKATSMPHVSSGGSSQNIPLYSAVSSESSPYGRSVPKLQVEPVSYGIDNNKEFRYIQGTTPDANDHSFSPEASAFGTWRLMPSHQVSSTKLESQLMGPSSTQQTTMSNAFEPINDSSVSRQMQQHSFLGDEIGVKEEQHSVHPFFNEWPTTKESWSALDDYNGSDKNVFSSTQLSISIPRTHSDFSSRSGYSPNDA